MLPQEAAYLHPHHLPSCTSPGSDLVCLGVKSPSAGAPPAAALALPKGATGCSRAGAGLVPLRPLCCAWTLAPAHLQSLSLAFGAPSQDGPWALSLFGGPA